MKVTTAAFLLLLSAAASTASHGLYNDIIDGAASQHSERVRPAAQKSHGGCPLAQLREDVRVQCGATALASCLDPQIDVQKMMEDMLNFSLRAEAALDAIMWDNMWE